MRSIPSFVRPFAALLFVFSVAACDQVPTEPLGDPAPSEPSLDITNPPIDEEFPLYVLPGVTVTAPAQEFSFCGSVMGACGPATPYREDIYLAVDGWAHVRGGGASGWTGPVDFAANGPGAFFICVAALWGGSIDLAAIGVYLDNWLTYAEAFDEYWRILATAELTEAQRVNFQNLAYNARDQRDNAQTALALALGASPVVVFGIVRACSPALVAPTG